MNDYLSGVLSKPYPVYACGHQRKYSYLFLLIIQIINN